MQGNGRPKGCFWIIRFLLSPEGLLLKTSETLELIEKIVLSVLAFWTTVSPHDACSAPLVLETGRIRFRGVRFQTPSSVSFFWAH